jgi:hypothetical protein
VEGLAIDGGFFHWTTFEYGINVKEQYTSTASVGWIISREFIRRSGAWQSFIIVCSSSGTGGLTHPDILFSAG